jgi:hypothetical protein
MADVSGEVNKTSTTGQTVAAAVVATGSSEPDYKKLYEAEKSHAAKFEEELTGFKVKLKDNDINRVLEKAKKYDEVANKVTDPDGIAKRAQEIEQEISERYSRKLTEKEERERKLEQELNELRVVTPATQEAAKFFTADGLKLIAPLVKASLSYENGEIVVKDSSGKPRPSKKDPRVAKMPLSEFMEELAGEYPSVALNKAPAGSKQAGGEKITGNGTASVPLKTAAEVSAMQEGQRKKYFQQLAQQPGGAKLIDKILSGTV